MRETGTMKVLQTLGCPVQLLSRLSEGSSGESEVTYQFQSVCVIILEVLNDVPMRHPLRHYAELSFLHVPLNSSKCQNVRMG